MFAKQLFKGIPIKYKALSCLLLPGLMFMLFPVLTQAQQPADTIRTDTTVIFIADTSVLVFLDTSAVKEHSPRKAIMYSLVFPGLGQVYNKKYWKIPFIYGGSGAFVYYISFNQMKYKKFRDAVFKYEDTKEDVEIDGYTYRYETLERGRDVYRRYRDISIAGLAAMYLINVIDAMVDAYFYRYDISDNLSMKIEPAVIQNIGLKGETASLGFRINIGF